MIESEYRQLVLEGATTRLSSLLTRPPSWSRVEFDLGHYEYDRLADEYARLFGADRIKVFSFAAINADQAAFIGELADFLDVGPWPRVPASVLARRVNRGMSPRLLGLRRFLNHFERSPLNPDPVLALRPVWRSPLSALTARLPARARPLIDAATAEQLRDRYQASNARLHERYGVELVGDRTSGTGTG
jgi:hypothetical protein